MIDFNTKRVIVTLSVVKTFTFYIKNMKVEQIQDFLSSFKYFNFFSSTEIGHCE